MSKLLTPQRALEVSGQTWAPWLGLTSLLGHSVFGLQRSLKLTFEGEENIPDTPCIIATNHTHNYDFLPLRYLFYQRRGILMSTWIKARAWQNSLMMHYLSNTGNVPLASRGYIISGDFRETIGRKPSDEEYRVLRDHLDHGSELPKGEVFQRLQRQKRMFLGTNFSPSEHTYRETVERCFEDFMESTLVVAERAVQSGHHQHLNPQGTRSSRLTQGKTGTIHIAARLKLPILPVSVLGMREAMPNQGLKSSGGEIIVRCGEVYTPDLNHLSSSYRPFFVDKETDQRIIDHELSVLMQKINALCDERYCMQEDYINDGKTGVDRFL